MNAALTILAIDDNIDDRENYCRALNKAGEDYRYLEASDGLKGLKTLQEKAIDCVLLDYSLPGINGLDILKKIRADHPLIPVILLTGQGNESIAVEAIKHGAYDYITKSSVTPERLQLAIDSSIKHSRMRRDILEKDEEIAAKTTALWLSEQRYELAVQGLSVGVWDWDIKSNALYWSPRFREIICCNHDDELKDHYEEWESRLHPEDREHTVNMLMGHLQNKGPYDVEYRLRRKDGSYVWIHAKGQAVWDDKGDATRMVGSIEDITDRRHAQTERDNMISKLTQSNSELERFAYVCSHDLQEPLRMISNFSERLEKHLGQELDEKGQHYMKYIMDGAGQARQLISDVLNYARVDHEAEHLDNIDAERTLTGVLRDLSARIEETGANITHDALPQVHMQPTHLRQILQNLIGNALKFCSQKPHIHVGAIQDGGMWRFFVRDNGIGIASEHLEKIFYIFQRLHSREKYPGTGIGLALCKKVTQKYGGQIWVESMPGKGSTFYFTLPPETNARSEAA